MSGGSMCYLYSQIQAHLDFKENTPERKAFMAHMQLVIKALHDIEWVDSCDYSDGDENEAIMACLEGRHASAELSSRAAALEQANKELLEAMRHIEGVAMADEPRDLPGIAQTARAAIAKHGETK